MTAISTELCWLIEKAEKIGDEEVEAVIVRTLESQPENATHWSSRELAKVSGVSTSSVQRIWRAVGLQPHRVENFKLSKDPLFVEKVRDVVGLYLGAEGAGIWTATRPLCFGGQGGDGLCKRGNVGAHAYSWSIDPCLC